jgi:hypothetical protein
VAKFNAVESEVPTSKAGAMSYVQLLVGLGYHYWHRGAVWHEKALGFVQKMSELYPISLGETQRNRAKAKGVANVKLVLFPDMKVPGQLVWYLMATPGKGLIHEREKMKSALVSPVLWLDQYELQRRSRWQLSGGKCKNRLRWTWVFQGAYKLSLQDSIRTYCATAEAKKELLLLFDNLRHIPLFSGVRDELYELDRYAEATWRKTHKSVYQPHCSELPFITRIAVFEGLTLGVLVEKMAGRVREEKAKSSDLAEAVLLGDDAAQSLTQSLRLKHGTAQKEVAPDCAL